LDYLSTLNHLTNFGLILTTGLRIRAWERRKHLTETAWAIFPIAYFQKTEVRPY